jgi:hypothetical protein
MAKKGSHKKGKGSHKKGKGSHKGASRGRRASCRNPAAVAVSPGGTVAECCWGKHGKADVLHCRNVSPATLKRRNIVKVQKAAAAAQARALQVEMAEMVNAKGQMGPQEKGFLTGLSGRRYRR